MDTKNTLSDSLDDLYRVAKHTCKKLYKSYLNALVIVGVNTLVQLLYVATTYLVLMLEI